MNTTKPVLSRKHASLLFLHTLAASQSSSSRSYGALPSLSAPSRPGTRSQSRQAAPSRVPVQPGPLTSFPLPNGRSKAEILREYRSRTGKPSLTLTHGKILTPCREIAHFGNSAASRYPLPSPGYFWQIYAVRFGERPRPQSTCLQGRCGQSIPM